LNLPVSIALNDTSIKYKYIAGWGGRSWNTQT